MDHRKKSGDKMWNGNGATDKESATTTSTFTSSTTISGNSSFYRCETQREISSSSFHTEAVTSQCKEVPSQQTSSFILQRVERLYGPGALAQGFYARRSLNTPSTTPQKETQEEVVKDTGKETALPVLRLLRPEFRAQLTVAKRKSSSPVVSQTRSSDTPDGVVERIIPVVVEAQETCNSKKIEERETVNTSVEKDGQYFLKLVLEEMARLERLAADMDAEVSSVPEYMEGRLRAAAGKARLLASQKLAQFKGLCHKNINQDKSEDFPTTCEDLAGFWDMVSIQVNNVHEEFNQIDTLRKAGWPQQDNGEEGVKKETVSTANGNARRTKNAPTQSKAVPAKSNISKARDEARKRMLAERRKEMRKNANTNEDIVIV